MHQLRSYGHCGSNQLSKLGGENNQVPGKNAPNRMHVHIIEHVVSVVGYFDKQMCCISPFNLL